MKCWRKRSKCLAYTMIIQTLLTFIIYTWVWEGTRSTQRYPFDMNTFAIYQYPQKDLERITDNEERRKCVIDAISHAWYGYVTFAKGFDELQPLTRTGVNNWGNLQWTLVDSLDTLWLAGLDEALSEARMELESSSFYQNSITSTFEVTIRLLGGCLSAYDLTGDKVYLLKAKSVADIVMSAFSSSSGLPAKRIHMIFGSPSFMKYKEVRTNTLVGMGSIQLELAHMSYVTGNAKYEDAAIKILKHLREVNEGGLYNISYNIDTGESTSSHRTMGSGADSFYEYLLKLFILRGGKDDWILEMYLGAMDDMMENLIKDFKLINDTSYILTSTGKKETLTMYHLECYVGGMLALGADYGKKNNITALVNRYEKHMSVAKGLTETCVYFYTSQPTGLSAESYTWKKYQYQSLKPKKKNYLLRPETLESLFILYRTTGEKKYQEMGWTIFRSIEKSCRIDVGYASVKDVTKSNLEHQNKMESFLLGETLKYALLLFSPEELLPLDKYILTTEAHPLLLHQQPESKV